MGIQILITHTTLEVRDKEVLMAMACFSDKEGKGVFASLETLAQRVTELRMDSIYGPRKAISKRSIQRQKKAIERKGLITRTNASVMVNGWHLPVFNLNLPAIRKHTISGQFPKRSRHFEPMDKKADFGHLTTKGRAPRFDVIDRGDIVQ